MQHKLNNRIKVLLMVSALFSVFFLFAPISHASTEVYFQKEPGQITKGDTFSADLKISSDEMINAVDGTITYDKDKLEIKEVKTNNSLFSLWVKQPAFDNTTGELSFVGGTPDGFKGKGGLILEITFFAKEEGSAAVGFKDIFSVFKNDGKGTSVNPWLKPMSFSINEKPGVFKDKYYEYGIGILILILIAWIIRSKFFIKTKK